MAKRKPKYTMTSCVQILYCIQCRHSNQQIEVTRLHKPVWQTWNHTLTGRADARAMHIDEVIAAAAAGRLLHADCLTDEEFSINQYIILIFFCTAQIYIYFNCLGTVGKWVVIQLLVVT